MTKTTQQRQTGDKKVLAALAAAREIDADDPHEAARLEAEAATLAVAAVDQAAK